MWELPQWCRWILASNFNMVEARLDKNNPFGRFLSISEQIIFDQLKHQLGVVYNLRYLDSFHFSLDNSREDGICVLAQLDDTYFF